MSKKEIERPPWPDGRIFFCQPGYAAGQPSSHKAFWVNAVRPGSRLDGKITRVTLSGMSLLANGFNQCLVHCLNLQEAFDAGKKARLNGALHFNPLQPGPDFMREHWEAGWNLRDDQRIDYFAMLHDDITPEVDFLTVLHDELRASRADLLSAVVPLKDALGVTSTAIDCPLDKFQVLRRLTMAEVYALPETFSAADCGYPDNLLLANSGCWICRMDLPLWRETNEDGSLKMRFNIDDKIVWDPNRKAWIALCASEDWEFSRDLGRMGGKVLCTRKVRLIHWGQLPYDNKSGDWGQWDHDQVTAHRFGGKPIANAVLAPDPANAPRFVPSKPSGWSARYPDVRGWLRDSEGEALMHLAEGKTVLEIGSFCGLSTIWLARSAEKVHAVDTWDGRDTPSPGNTLGEFFDNLEKHGVRGKVKAWRGTSEEILGPGTLADWSEGVDVVFVDGAHVLEQVRKDIALALSVLKPGGLLAFHDFGAVSHPDVTIAVHGDLLVKGAKLLGVVDSLAVVDPSPMLAGMNGKACHEREAALAS